MFKIVHAPGRDIPVPVNMKLNRDLLIEIHLWGLKSLEDSSYWDMCIKETMRRGEKWGNSKWITVLNSGHLIEDEYIFYFSNKEDAALFKLTWT